MILFFSLSLSLFEDELQNYCIRPGVYDPDKLFTAKNFGAHIYVHERRGLPNELASPDVTRADAAVMPEDCPLFDGWVRFPDGKLLMLQMKGRRKDRATDKKDDTMTYDDVKNDFFAILHKVLQPTDAQLKQTFMLKEMHDLMVSLDKSKLFVEFCTTRRMTEETRNKIVAEGKSLGLQMCVVAPDQASALSSDRMVRAVVSGRGREKKRANVFNPFL